MSTTPLAATEKVTLLLNLISYLRTHGGTPVPHLAEHFRVTPEVIRTMASFIGTAGVPGEDGAYQHQDLYDIDWDALEAHDIVDLKHLVGVDGTPRFTSLQASALLAGLRSLRAVLDEDDAHIAASAEEKLRLASNHDGTALTMSEHGDPLSGALTVTKNTIMRREQLGFRYIDREGNVSERTIDAHRLVRIEGAWYVEGWCHDREAMRTFRLEFMHDLTHTGVSQLHPAEPAHRTSVTVERARGVRVELLVSAEHLYRIASWKPKRVGRASHDRVRVTVTLIHESRVIPLVCAAPGNIEVVAPETVRSMVGQWAEEVAQAVADKDSIH